MVEVTLVSTTGRDSNIGTFVARKRANLDLLKINKNEFIHGFLRSMSSELSLGVSSSELMNLINSDTILNNKDIETINYMLADAGYKFLVYFVSDDESNSDQVAQGTYEFNIIDKSFIQDDLPTVTKINQDGSNSIADVLNIVLKNCGLFDPDKFAGIANPFTKYIESINQLRKITGQVPESLVSQLWTMLGQMGIEFFVVVGRNI